MGEVDDDAMLGSEGERGGEKMEELRTRSFRSRRARTSVRERAEISSGGRAVTEGRDERRVEGGMLKIEEGCQTRKRGGKNRAGAGFDWKEAVKWPDGKEKTGASV